MAEEDIYEVYNYDLEIGLFLIKATHLSLKSFMFCFSILANHRIGVFFEDFFMIDPNKITEAINEFIANPTWKDIFMNAPGGAMERLAIAFYFSKFHDDFKPEDFQEYRDLRDEYEKSMTEEDLTYLIANSDKENAIKHYQELLDKIQSGQQPTGTMRFEKEEQEEATQGGEENVEETETAEIVQGENSDSSEESDENVTVKEEEEKNQG